MNIGFSRAPRFARALLASTSALCLTVGGALAADPPGSRAPAPPPIFTQVPAVDGVNGKVEAWGGWARSSGVFRRNNSFSGGGAASFSVPLGQSFGFQADGLLASHRGGLAAGGAGHLFWRDPSRALVGAYGSAVRVNAFGATRARVGGEGALYFDRFTLVGVAGVELGTGGGVRPVAYAPGLLAFDRGFVRTRFFDMADVWFYATPNWKFSLGHRYVGGRHAAALGTEALLFNIGGTAISGFIDARIGERDYKAALVGVKVYFGQKDKSLIQRHRQDDPPNWLRDDLFAPGNASRGVGYASLPGVTAPPTPPTCPCGPCYAD